jgi:hypothetical protein
VFYVATTHTTTRKRTWIRSKERTIDRYTWDAPAALDQTRFNYYVVSVVIYWPHKKENRPLPPIAAPSPRTPISSYSSPQYIVHQATCVCFV